MDKKTKKVIISAVSALVIAIAGFFGIDLASDKNKSTESSSVSSSSVIQTTTFSAETTAVVQTTSVDITDAPTETKSETITEAQPEYVEYHFRSKKQLEQHFDKHESEFADDFGYASPEEYEKGASDVINAPEALYKTEAEDGDGVYYIESTNEFVILSTDGYIRTYFRPSGGKSYFERQ